LAKSKSPTSNKGKKSDSADNGSNKGLDQSFSAAIRAAQSSPESEESWDHLEDLADSLQRPDEVAEAYRDVLTAKLSPEIMGMLAERAVGFHEEWFGDKPSEMNRVLSKIIEINPDADWAFERLTVVLTVAEQWDDLLLAYDHVIEMTEDEAKHKQLLDDAANAAKSLANRPDRAVEYLMELFALEPENKQLATSIERTLEKLERFSDLVELWQNRIAVLDGEEARETRLRIIDACIEHLDNTRTALVEIGLLMDAHPGDEKGAAALERILVDDNTSVETRLGALELLIGCYDAADNPEAAVTAIEKATEIAEPAERLDLYRQAGIRHTAIGNHETAIGHFSALLKQHPADMDARKQLRQSAEKSDRRDLQAKALVEATEACEDISVNVTLQVEAAYLYWEFLDNAEAAIDLFTNVLKTPDTEPSLALSVAHNLNELLGATGRTEDRLQVLEHLAELERAAVVRKTILGEAAQMAAELGDPDKALSFWETRLKNDETDLEALSAVVDLLAKHERWEEMIAALRRRIEAPVLPQQRRTDLVLIAKIQADQVGDVSGAIENWLKILDEFGIGRDILEALDQLMSQDDRWEELAEILGNVATTGYKQVSDLFCRLGDIHRTKFDNVEQAARYYANTLMLEPSNEDAQAGLKDMINHPDAATMAVKALTRAFEATDDWQGLIDLLEPRLIAASDNRARARLLADVGRLQETNLSDADAAFSSYARALPIEPTDTTLEQELLRLAEDTKHWEEAAEAFRSAADVVDAFPARLAHLRFVEGDIREFRTGDAEGALKAYSAVVEIDSERTDALHATIRVASRAGLWDTAANALITTTLAHDHMDQRTLELIETTAEEVSAWDSLVASMEKTIEERDIPRPELARDLENKLAEWHMDRREDAEAAQAATRRAVAHDPADVKTLDRLASLQRKSPDQELIGTLGLIHTHAPQNMDPLLEAAEVGLEILDDYAAKRALVLELFREASGLWRYEEVATGQTTAEAATVWAIDKMVELDTENGAIENAAQILLSGARLPFGADDARKMRIRAADMLNAEGKRGQAIEIYRDVRIEAPANLELLEHVAPLLEQENRIPELLVVLRRELELTEDPEKRLALRLDISRFVGMLEGEDERVRSLRANLDEQPGHQDSVNAISEILRNKDRFLALADLLEEQAGKLQAMEKTDEAAALWAQAADLAEKQISDPERAITTYEKAVDLNCTIDSLDALARLSLSTDKPAEAASWLRRRLVDTEDPKEQVAILIRLARAQIKASQFARAVASLETAFNDAPRNAEVRKLLFGQYRYTEDWENLADALSTASEHISDESAILSYAQEAASIYFERLGAPERAVPVLERALPHAGEDRDLRQMLAEGLLLNDRADEAREITLELLSGFGRRRSAERAMVHLLLARIEHKLDNTDEALDQLDKASKMDSQNIDIWQALAELAKESGQIERAEKAYRTLLLMVRRAEPGRHIGASEVFLELSEMAEHQGDSDQASELRESVLEAVSKNDAEAPRLQERLLRDENHDFLKRIYETRLGSLENKRRRAEALAGLGDLLQGPLEQPDEALAVRIRAVRNNPGSPLLHDAAYGLAEEVDGKDDYIEELESLLKTTRRGSDANAKCEIMLRLGKAMENDREDLDQAKTYYDEAEGTGVREVDVWRAAVGLAQKREDKEEQMRLLTNLANLGEDGAAEEDRADAFYRLAEVQLSAEETVTEGLESLERALRETPRYGRSGRILRRACEARGPGNRLLAVYEKVARQADDDEMLLDYLERLSSTDDVTVEGIREGAQLALKLEEDERAESLMMRAVDIGEGSTEGMTEVAWALIGLAARRKAIGDLAGSVKWLIDASEVSDPESVFALSAEIAEASEGPDGDHTLAIKLYEHLLEQNSMEREVWEPLAEMYYKIGDKERLAGMVEGLLDSLSDTNERNLLKLKEAKLLLTLPENEADAVETLKEILLEDPEHEEATEILADYFERTGREGEMFELLHSQFESAKSRQDAGAVKVCAVRLGKVHREDEPEQAITVYKDALTFVPDDKELLQGLLDCSEGDLSALERAVIMEKILASEDDEAAASLTLELVAIYESLEDDGAILRVLDLGIRRAPGDITLTERLEALYRDRGDNAGLAQMLIKLAEATDDADLKIQRLKEAAGIYSEQLNDSEAAISLIKMIAAMEPDNPAHRIDLARALVASGANEDAMEHVTALLEDPDLEEMHLELITTRAQIHMATGDEDAAIADLEKAYEGDPEPVAPILEEALQQKRKRAVDQEDRELERDALSRLVNVMLAQEKRSEAAGLLLEWVDRDPEDTKILHLLLGLYEGAGQHEDVAKVCSRLIDLEKGDAQIELGQRFAEACVLAERPDAARVQLEQIYLRQPDSEEIRSELRRVYELSGAQKELAMMLKEDADKVEDETERAELLRKIGMVLLSIDEIEEAAPALKASLEILPGDPEATAALADVLLADGDIGGATEMLDEAISKCKGQRSPQLAVLQHRRAKVAQAQDDQPGELSWLKQAVLSDRASGWMAVELTDRAEACEDWDMAIWALRTIAMMKEDSPLPRSGVFLRQGKIALVRGDEKRAKLFARQAQQEDEESESVKAFLEQLGIG